MSPYAPLWATVSGNDGESLLIDWQDGSRRESSYFPVADADRFEHMLRFHQEQRHDPKVGLVPRRDRSYDNLGQSSVLWASIENPVSVRAFAAFRPLPTLLFRTGRKQVAVWWLTKPLPMQADPSQDWVTRANKRLAFALKANSRHAAPEWLMPLGELVEADPDRRYDAAQIVKRLRDAPVRLLPKR